MIEIKELKENIEQSRPNEWKTIPDIDLYMDQVINYMPRQHIGLEGDETLTAAMINNYIKSELLPRAHRKKYKREHIAYLTAICLMKQVLSVGDTGLLLKEQLENNTIEEFYNKYVNTVDEEFKRVSKDIDAECSKEELVQMALRLVVSSYAQKHACESILKILGTMGEEPEKKLPKK
ncbi:MAG: DUF1836 domain-containing protein [Eubacteriales bacterium]